MGDASSGDGHKHISNGGKIMKTHNVQSYTILFFSAVALVFIFGVAFLQLFPFYQVEQPFEVIGNNFRQGDMVVVKTDRKSILNMTGDVARELIRIEHTNDHVIYHEVEKAEYKVIMEKGQHPVTQVFRLPRKDIVNLIPNTYKYSGSVTYHPFGLFVSRELYWETEKFQIVDSDDCE